MPYLLAGEIMDKAAGLMNDSGKQVYTYPIQIQYLQMALQDLRKKLELNNSQVTDETSAIITIPAGTTSVTFTANTTPRLPDDLIEIQKLWESQTGQNKWIPMTRKEYLPHYSEGVTVGLFGIFTWMSNEIRFPEANVSIDLKIDYIKSLFTTVTNENSLLSIIDAASYLEYRTAALLAEFIGENPTRASSLNGQALVAFDILAGIDNKGKQGIMTRRRPFRNAWKSRGVR